METKKCTKCGEVKPFSAFHKCSAKKDGKKNACMICSREQNRNYYYENSEKMKSQHRDWSKKNRDKGREYYAKYVKAHPEYLEKARIRSLEYKKENKDEIKSKNLDRYYVLKNNREYIEKRRDSYKKYMAKNRKKVNDRSRIKKKKGVEELSDVYVKDKLKIYGDCPQELIEAKRAQLKLHRATR